MVTVRTIRLVSFALYYKKLQLLLILLDLFVYLLGYLFYRIGAYEKEN